MGAVALKIGDGTARFRRVTLFSTAVRLLMLFSLLFTNVFALYAFTYRRPPPASGGDVSAELAQIARQIEIEQKKLTQIGNEKLGYETLDLAKPVYPAELKLYLHRHSLTLGRDAKSGITEMVSSVGHRCTASGDMLAKFMNYSPGRRCPSDALLAGKLLASGCEPLPRRRCLSVTTPPPTLTGSQSSRWVKPRGKNEFQVDEVLASVKGVRIGFDVDGGEFAAVMALRNVTIVTGSPVNGGEGLFPLQLTSSQRFPFADSVFDLVRTSKAEEKTAMEFLMFDFERVLRPGGVLWLDCLRIVDEKEKLALTGLIQKFGFKRLNWVVGEKADGSAVSGKVLLLSALLQKPARV